MTPTTRYRWNVLWYDPFRPDFGVLLTANRGGAVRYWNPDR